MSTPILEIVGVYNADGSVIGELRYVIGKIMGTAHCALCDITHGLVKQKNTFSRLCESLPIPLRTVHLDERSEDLIAFTTGKTPCVVGQTNEGWVMLIDAGALEACGKDVAKFEAVLRDRLES